MCLLNLLKWKEGKVSLAVYRSINGKGNNVEHPDWGSTGATLVRIAKAHYADGKSIMVGQSTPREISNALCAQTYDQPSTVTQLLTVWGQFLDHELDLTSGGPEDASMSTPLDPCPPPDKFAGCEKWPGRTIPFTRSLYHTDSEGVRQYSNEITAFIDASNVYGSTEARAHALRKNDGSGELKASIQEGTEYLPYNVDELPNASLPGQDPKSLYLAGDIRANENVLLTAIHTLFLREHNRRCRELKKQHPGLDGEQLYQRSRAWLAGIMQEITFKEFLPILLGHKTPTYTPYDCSINPGIAVEFAAAGYRFGHSLVSQTVPITTPATGGHGSIQLQLSDCFFQPSLLPKYSMDAFILGASKHCGQQLDLKVVPALRSFLFESPSIEFLHDLPSLNIQRGRDEGVSKYNAIRQAYGLKCNKEWCDVTKDECVQKSLATVYTSPDEMDLWVGCLAEDKCHGMTGELLHAILFDQFSRLQRGDRYFYTRDPTLCSSEKSEIAHTTFSDVILRNTKIKYHQLGSDAFKKHQPCWLSSLCNVGKICC